MNRGFCLISLALLVCGCQVDQVRQMSNRLGSTVPDLYYEQVLDNLALSYENPAAIPYFGVPSQGTSTNTRLIQGNYTANWDLVFTTLSMAKFLERYFFDKQSGAITGSNQNQEAFQVTPLRNPDNILLVQFAFQVANNKVLDPSFGYYFSKFFDSYDSFGFYRRAIKPCWFIVTSDRWEAHRARKGGCLVGHHGSTYVYVPRRNFKDLADFTLAILDLATVDLSQKSEQSRGDVLVAAGKLKQLDSQARALSDAANKLQATALDAFSWGDFEYAANTFNQGEDKRNDAKILNSLKDVVKYSELLPPRAESFGAPRIDNPVVAPPPNAPTIQ
jgi:hypothetical protein